MSVAGTPKQKKAKKEPDDPAKASKAQIAKIEAELTKILKDEANDKMSYAGMLQAGGRVVYARDGGDDHSAV